MSLNETLRTALVDALGRHLEHPAELTSFQSVAGGSINQAYRAEAGGKVFFVKVNDAGPYPEMLDKEARGLEFIGTQSEFRVPRVIKTGIAAESQFLIAEFIKPAPETPGYWEKFGRRLARMHRRSSATFGLEYDNYIGSMVQNNCRADTWAEFFVEQRLQPQLKIARDFGRAGASMVRSFDKLFARAEELFPNEPPSALHGDLWSGNFMTGADGHAVIFDPAVYFGHREMDIAMAQLFGGFDDEFYSGYHSEYPLEKDWNRRAEIANLYPLMVHVNLFGGGYAAQVREVLNRF